MKNEEAKFILGAYRPDGQDAGDPNFAAALTQANQDPHLRAWLEKQQGFDAALATKLAQIAPPPGLREAILAGARASASAQPHRAWWTRPIGLSAAAAAVAVLVTLAFLVFPKTHLPSGAELAAFALKDLSEAHGDHVGGSRELSEAQARLVSAKLPLTQSLDLSPNDLRQRRCWSVRLAGRELFEVCFQREGVWYHVYVGRRQDFAAGEFDPHRLVRTQGAFASTAWTDRDYVYALVTDAGQAALRRLL